MMHPADKKLNMLVIKNAHRDLYLFCIAQQQHYLLLQSTKVFLHIDIPGMYYENVQYYVLCTRTTLCSKLFIRRA